MSDNVAVPDPLRKMPVALQKRILLRFLLGGIVLLLTVLCSLRMPDVRLIVPGLALTVFFAVSGMRLYIIASAQRYAVLECRCISVARSKLFRHTRAIMLETDGKRIRLSLRQRNVRVREGDLLRLYLADGTRVYEQDDALLVCDYILLESRH